MPVAQDQGNQLKTILRASPRNIVPSLEKFLTSSIEIPQTCEPSMISKLHGILKETFYRVGQDEEALGEVQTVLQVIQHIANFREEGGIVVFLENGLIDMISDVFMSSLRIIKEGKEPDADKLYEEVLETIGTVAESGPKGRARIIEKFIDRLLQIIISNNFSFTTRIESLKTANVILERCPASLRESMRNSSSHRELMYNLAKLVPAAGDYEFQVGITECLFRLTFKADRADFARKWFGCEHYLQNFLSIRDSDFETDCRKFLFSVNDCDDASVVTLPATMVLLGNYKLKKPQDSNYDTFWIDFNSGSARISLFCDPDVAGSQDEDNLWETVSVWADSVEKYTVQETEDTKELLIELNSSARDLISFGPEFNSKMVTIHLITNCDILQVLEKTFGLEKMAVVQKHRKASVGCPIRLSSNILTGSQTEYSQQVQSVPKRPKVSIAIPISLSQESFTENNPSKHVKPRLNDHSTEIQSFQDSEEIIASAPKMRIRKTSAPKEDLKITGLVPVGRKQSSAYSSSSPVASGLVTTTAPRTPTSKNSSQKKVKTPLQFVKPVQQDPVPSSDQRSPETKTRSCSSKPGRGMRVKKDTDAVPCHTENSQSEMVIPSSLPGEDIQEFQQSTRSRFPALAGKSNQQKNMKRGKKISDDSGVCMETTMDNDETNISKQLESKEDFSDKTKEMAELKERLEMSDPEYCILPKNTHKVSTTPELSTVAEESIPSSGFRNKDHLCLKDFPSSLRSEPIIEEDEDDIIEDDDHVDPQEKATSSKDPEPVHVGRFYRKNHRNKADHDVTRMSPDSTSQPMKQAKSDVVEVYLPVGLDINPELYERESQESNKSQRSSASQKKCVRGKKKEHLPDVIVTDHKPGRLTRSQRKTQNSDMEVFSKSLPETRRSTRKNKQVKEEFSQEVREIPETQPSSSENELNKTTNNGIDHHISLQSRQSDKTSAEAEKHSISKQKKEISKQKKESKTFVKQQGQNKEKMPYSTIDDENSNNSEDFDLVIEDSYRPEDDQNTSKDITLTPKFSPKSYSRKSTPKRQDRLDISHGTAPEKKKNKPKIQPKFFKSRLLQFSGNGEESNTSDSAVFEFEPDLDVSGKILKGKGNRARVICKQSKMQTEESQEHKGLARAKQKMTNREGNSSHADKLDHQIPEKNDDSAIDADVSSNTNETNQFEALVKSILSKSSDAPRSTRTRKPVNYREPLESDIGSELDFTPASISNKCQAKKSARIDPAAVAVDDALGMKNKASHQKYQRKNRIFSETDENTDSRSEVSWLGSTARKRKPKAPKTYDHMRADKRGRLLTGKAYKKQNEEEFTIGYDDSHPVSVEKESIKHLHHKNKRIRTINDLTDEEQSDQENLYYRPNNKAHNRKKKKPQEPFEFDRQIGRCDKTKKGSELPDTPLKTPRKPKKRSEISSKLDSSSWSPRIVLSEMSANKSIERCRDDQADLNDTCNYQLNISGLEGPRMTSSPVSKSQDKVRELDDLMSSQWSAYTHISTIKTPKTPAPEEPFEPEEEEFGLLYRDNNLDLFSLPLSLIKSGPCKRRAINKEIEEQSLNSEEEEEEDGGNAEDMSGLEPIDPSLRPRCLFTQPDVPAPEENNEQDNDNFDACMEENGAEDLYISLSQKNNEEENDVNPTGDDNDNFDASMENEEENDANPTDDSYGISMAVDPIDYDTENKQDDMDNSVEANSLCDEPAELPEIPLEVGMQAGVSTLLQSFGVEVQKTLMAKKRQLENLTKEVLTSSEKQLDGVWLADHKQREKLLTHFKQAFLIEVLELEKDMDKNKETEELIVNFFRQQQLVMSKSRNSQKQRLGNLMNLENQLHNDISQPLAMSTQQKSREILRKEMNLLQKRILQQTQQQEFHNVKRSLQAFFM